MIENKSWSESKSLISKLNLQGAQKVFIVSVHVEGVEGRCEVLPLPLVLTPLLLCFENPTFGSHLSSETATSWLRLLWCVPCLQGFSFVSHFIKSRKN